MFKNLLGRHHNRATVPPPSISTATAPWASVLKSALPLLMDVTYPVFAPDRLIPGALAATADPSWVEAPNTLTRLSLLQRVLQDPPVGPISTEARDAILSLLYVGADEPLIATLEAWMQAQITQHDEVQELLIAVPRRPRDKLESIFDAARQVRSLDAVRTLSETINVFMDLYPDSTPPLRYAFTTLTERLQLAQGNPDALPPTSAKLIITVFDRYGERITLAGEPQRPFEGQLATADVIEAEPALS